MCVWAVRKEQFPAELVSVHRTDRAARSRRPLQPPVSSFLVATFVSAANPESLVRSRVHSDTESPSVVTPPSRQVRVTRPQLSCLAGGQAPTQGREEAAPAWQQKWSPGLAASGQENGAAEATGTACSPTRAGPHTEDGVSVTGTLTSRRPSSQPAARASPGLLAHRHGTCSEDTELVERRAPRALCILRPVSLGTSTKQITTAGIAEISLQQKRRATKRRDSCCAHVPSSPFGPGLTVQITYLNI